LGSCSMVGTLMTISSTCGKKKLIEE